MLIVGTAFPNVTENSRLFKHNVAGQQCYLFASIDDDSCYWLANDMADNKFHHNTDNLLDMTKKQAGKTPRNFITDGLQAYMKSSSLKELK